MNQLKLPKGYRKIDTIDLDKNKKDKRTVNLLAMLLTVALALVGNQLRPFTETSEELFNKTWVLLALLAVLFAYMVLHEVIHGAFIRIRTGSRPVYGMKSMYLYAGSSAYMDRSSYVIIALAPVVIWAVILAALSFLLPKNWFWLVHIVQIANIAGSVGDFYCVRRVLGMPKDILIQDSGTDARIYAPERS